MYSNYFLIGMPAFKQLVTHVVVFSGIVLYTLIQWV